MTDFNFSRVAKRGALNNGAGRGPLKNSVTIRSSKNKKSLSIIISGDYLPKVPAPIGSFVQIICDDQRHAFLITSARPNDECARRVNARGQNGKAGCVNIASSELFNLIPEAGEPVECLVEKHASGLACIIPK